MRLTFLLLFINLCLVSPVSSATKPKYHRYVDLATKTFTLNHADSYSYAVITITPKNHSESLEYYNKQVSKRLEKQYQRHGDNPGKLALELRERQYKRIVNPEWANSEKVIIAVIPTIRIIRGEYTTRRFQNPNSMQGFSIIDTEDYRETCIPEKTITIDPREIDPIFNIYPRQLSFFHEHPWLREIDYEHTAKAQIYDPKCIAKLSPKNSRVLIDNIVGESSMSKLPIKYVKKDFNL